MLLRISLVSLLLGTVMACPLHAALIITEVLFNEVGSNVGGEWIEIFNNGSAAIDLTSYKIGDEETSGATGTGEAMFQFPPGAMIGPGVVQIVSTNATRFNTVYGFLPTYETIASEPSVPDMTVYSTWDPDGVNINMANGGDHAFILDGGDAIVDAVNWDNNTFLNPGIVSAEADGQSYERINPYIDTDTAADWILGNPSSPGMVPVIPEPSIAALVVGCLISLGVGHRRRCT